MGETGGRGGVFPEAPQPPNLHKQPQGDPIFKQGTTLPIKDVTVQSGRLELP